MKIRLIAGTERQEAERILREGADTTVSSYAVLKELVALVCEEKEFSSMRLSFERHDDDKLVRYSVAEMDTAINNGWEVRPEARP